MWGNDIKYCPSCKQTWNRQKAFCWVNHTDRNGRYRYICKCCDSFVRMRRAMSTSEALLLLSLRSNQASDKALAKSMRKNPDTMSGNSVLTRVVEEGIQCSITTTFCGCYRDVNRPDVEDYVRSKVHCYPLSLDRLDDSLFHSAQNTRLIQQCFQVDYALSAPRFRSMALDMTVSIVKVRKGEKLSTNLAWREKTITERSAIETFFRQALQKHSYNDSRLPEWRVLMIGTGKMLTAENLAQRFIDNQHEMTMGLPWWEVCYFEDGKMKFVHPSVTLTLQRLNNFFSLTWDNSIFSIRAFQSCCQLTTVTKWGNKYCCLFDIGWRMIVDWLLCLLDQKQTFRDDLALRGVGAQEAILACFEEIKGEEALSPCHQNHFFQPESRFHKKAQFHDTPPRAQPDVDDRKTQNPQQPLRQNPGATLATPGRGWVYDSYIADHMGPEVSFSS